ncbi:2Fe-2S iron-sulfur cluster-binding protein [Tardiphaga sp.]|uniref:2Fe-2S iron-sulfur cluster-binding protein n=1 Tax=Tardiphaga sp. TaxID=1926292 RepID=UPI0025F07FBD|nr:2Fe-2S iron-sulfur cluster-binding protein [Tardiphaga sp.]
MAKICKVTFNDQSFFANCGDLLLDSALMNGVDIPHDCRAGICGACRVNVVKGQVYGGQDSNEDVIHACQARVISDLEIATEEVPPIVSTTAKLRNLGKLAADVFGAQLEVPKPFEFLPGQYCKVQFRGFPARCYSPTFPLEGGAKDRLLNFHIRTVKGGMVSSALGKQITVGHRVNITGPLGTAYFRPDHPGRMVLISSGTGFAPMWSVAVAAIRERPTRELVFIISSRSMRAMYMHRALGRLAAFPNVTIIPVVSERQTVSDVIRCGRPTDYMPELRDTDIVYTAGAPAMTKTIANTARLAGARCYTDPFVSDHSPPLQPSTSWVAQWFSGKREVEA